MRARHAIVGTVFAVLLTIAFFIICRVIAIAYVDISNKDKDIQRYEHEVEELKKIYIINP